MSTKKKIFIGLISAMGVFLLIKVSGRFLNGADNKITAEKVPVAVTPVKRAVFEDQLQLTGDIRGMNEARIYPKVPGRLLRKIKDAGDAVIKGEVVALIDRDEPALKFAAAEVTSPLDGVLTRYFLDLGQNVTPATPVCEVADVSPVKVVVRVTERDFPKVRIGMPARFTADPYPGIAFSGRVVKMSDAMDDATRSADVEIQAENPSNKLKPGMFARVSLISATRPGALAIPREALAAVGETTHVFVVGKSGLAEKRAVKLGLLRETDAEVLNGLAVGELVVTIGWHNLNDGTAVMVAQ
ncbi:MAG TPA: efflux RND transporter periplasmic adaptor subunit [Elusimicrobiales bacterium]|nr:efflux RND transporter periplasmic adaptor subunit [Elusimicrobiales bacterium]